VSPSSGSILVQCITFVFLHTNKPVFLQKSVILHPIDVSLIIIIVPSLVIVKRICKKLIHTVESSAVIRAYYNTWTN